MKKETLNNHPTATDGKSPVSSYSEEWKLKIQAARLRSIINSGLGITNKPISSKRMVKLKRNLAEIEAALNGC